jgi:lysophospholipase L1-like esterase
MRQVKSEHLAHDMEVPFISNNEFFNQYTLFKGVTLDSLLADGLHPNDTGYDLCLGI